MIKKLIIWGLVFFNTWQLLGQTVRWTRPSINYIYSNYPNQLFLAFEDVDADELELSVSDGKILMKGAYYAWQPNNAGKMAILTVKANGKVLDEFEFKVVRFADPTINLVPQNANSQTFKGLKAESTDDAYNIPLQVEAYVIEIRENGQNTTLYNEGAVIAPEHKKILEGVSAEAGVLLTIVRIRCPGDNVARRLTNIRLQ